MIDKSHILHIARLARMELKPEEVETLASQLGAILEFFEKLGECDTRDVEPAPYAIDLHDVLRKDHPGPSLPIEDTMRNNPTGDPASFRVPKILE